eukprot:RCo033060
MMARSVRQQSLPRARRPHLSIGLQSEPPPPQLPESFSVDSLPKYKKRKSAADVPVVEAPSAPSRRRVVKEPAQWKEVWRLIQQMRKGKDAPVDTMGCERLADSGVDEATHRFHILVGLMLSSQTRDEVTAAAMGRLKEYGLSIPRVLRAPEAKLRDLIYGVSFHNRKVEYPKMAHLFLQVAYGRTEGIGVDVHVHRICGR